MNTEKTNKKPKSPSADMVLGQKEKSNKDDLETSKKKSEINDSWFILHPHIMRGDSFFFKKKIIPL